METAKTATPQCPVHADRFEDEYNPFVSPQLENPLPNWRRAREERIFHSSALDAWIVSSYDDVVAVLRDPGTFGPIPLRKIFAEKCPEADAVLDALPPLTETNPVSAEPPVHTKLRRYLQPAFMPRRAAQLEPDLRRIAHELVDEFEAAGKGDFYHDYAFRYPLTVVCRLLGIPAEDQDKIKRWAEQRISLRYGNLDPAAQIEAANGQRENYEYTLELVAKRRAEPGDDMLSWIVVDSDASDDPLTEDQLGAQVTSMLTAGHETTAHWLTLMLRRLLQGERRRWNELVSDPSLATAVSEEGLRLDGPAQAVWRLAKVDTQIGGNPIPAGARISVVLGSANVDDAAFEEPEVFRPDRPNLNRHVAFGRGIHTCVGAGIARLEGRITLETLVERLPGLRLAEQDGIFFAPSAIQRMPKRLLVEWD